jgi:glycosyltransferase involved in cell wall biosynthesis
VTTGNRLQDKDGVHVLVACASDFQDVPYGGTLSLVRDLLSGWSSAPGWRFTLVGLGRSGQDLAPRAVRELGGVAIPFLPVGRIEPGARGSVRLAFMQGLMRRGHAIRALHPDLIYAHSPEAARALSWVLRDIPMVLHCHGIHNPLHLSRYRLVRSFGIPGTYDRMIYRPALAASSLVLVNGDSSQYEDFVSRNLQYLGGSIRRVPATVDLALFRPSEREKTRAELGLDVREPVAIFVGRIEEPKGLDFVLRSMAALKGRGRGVHLLVVGEGSHRTALESLTSELGLGDRVVFLGHRPRVEIPRYLNASDVFVSGTLREAVSMALLEAFACGVPAVVTDGGGARELIVDGRNGYVVTDRDPDWFGDRVLEVAAARGAMTEGCRRVAERYSSHAIGREVLEAFGDLLHTAQLQAEAS